ncbi:MAG: ABC transporter permease [Clostridia bacterium]|nr:ABC transporter permease [Clostridia bacterium]
MRKYLTYFRIRFIGGLQYRAAALAGISTQFAWGFLYILLYSAFYRADPTGFPMEFQQLASYVWLQQAFLALFMNWYYDSDILGMISGGTIAYELVRPLDIYILWFTKTVTARVSRAVLRCFPILIVAFLLPAPYGLTLPPTPLHAVMFVLTMVLGMFVVTAFSMLIYCACFYTVNATGVRMVAQAVADFLSGGELPLPFMPAVMRRVIELTPFGVMQNLPFRIYSGNITGNEMWFLTGMQLLWTTALILIGWFWMRAALKKVVVQGG